MSLPIRNSVLYIGVMLLIQDTVAVEIMNSSSKLCSSPTISMQPMQHSMKHGSLPRSKDDNEKPAEITIEFYSQSKSQEQEKIKQRVGSLGDSKGYHIPQFHLFYFSFFCPRKMRHPIGCPLIIIEVLVILAFGSTFLIDNSRVKMLFALP